MPRCTEALLKLEAVMVDITRMLFLNGNFCREGVDYNMVDGRPTLLYKLRKGDYVDLHGFEDGILVHVLYLRCEEDIPRGEPFKTTVLKEWVRGRPDPAVAR